MLVFFDTSAFAKRYVYERGTDEVLVWCDKATEIGLAGIALPETISAFCRLRREARITDAQYRGFPFKAGQVYRSRPSRF